jgi:hypothetical protein
MPITSLLPRAVNRSLTAPAGVLAPPAMLLDSASEVPVPAPTTTTAAAMVRKTRPLGRRWPKGRAAASGAERRFIGHEERSFLWHSEGWSRQHLSPGRHLYRDRAGRGLGT